MSKSRRFPSCFLFSPGRLAQALKIDDLNLLVSTCQQALSFQVSQGPVKRSAPHIQLPAQFCFGTLKFPVFSAAFHQKQGQPVFPAGRAVRSERISSKIRI